MHKYGLELLLWTGSFAKDDVKLIGHAKNLGFDGVEILINHPEEFPIDETKAALEDNDMGINFAVVLNDETNSISPDAEVRKKGLDFLKKSIDIAHAVSGGDCGIGGVNYAAWGYFTGVARTEKEWDWAVTNYREACRYAGDKGIDLCVEAINRFETHFINIAADAVMFCKDVGEPNAKAHLDAYHMIREEKDFYKAIVDTGSFLGYFHACENERGIPGTGLVPWETVYQALKDIDYQGWITIESFTPDLPDIARLTAIWRKHAPSADALAGEGLKNIKAVDKKIFG